MQAIRDWIKANPDQGRALMRENLSYVFLKELTGPGPLGAMNVPVTPQGGLTFEDGISAAGKYVEMRAEMDVICLISNCPQLNNPCNAYNPTPIRLLIWDEKV